MIARPRDGKEGAAKGRGVSFQVRAETWRARRPWPKRGKSFQKPVGRPFAAMRAEGRDRVTSRGVGHTAVKVRGWGLGTESEQKLEGARQWG